MIIVVEICIKYYDDFCIKIDGFFDLQAEIESRDILREVWGQWQIWMRGWEYFRSSGLTRSPTSSHSWYQNSGNKWVDYQYFPCLLNKKIYKNFYDKETSLVYTLHE